MLLYYTTARRYPLEGRSAEIDLENHQNTVVQQLLYEEIEEATLDGAGSSEVTVKESVQYYLRDIGYTQSKAYSLVQRNFKTLVSEGYIEERHEPQDHTGFN